MATARFMALRSWRLVRDVGATHASPLLKDKPEIILENLKVAAA